MFAALLAGANSMPAARFLLFNISGGICWACLFGFSAYAIGTEIYKISGVLTPVSLGLFIAAGSRFRSSFGDMKLCFVRPNEG
jgi:membrane protein DedA with SNARE-associated domain